MSEADISSLITALNPRLQLNGIDAKTRQEFLRGLPKLDEKDIVDVDDACPICQDTFLSVIAHEEMALVMDTPGLPAEQLGVTRLSCGHRFCRKDISVWVNTLHNTCPACRTLLPVPGVPALAQGDHELEEELLRQFISSANVNEEQRNLLRTALSLGRAGPGGEGGGGPPDLDTDAQHLNVNLFIPSTRGRGADDEYEVDRGYSSMYS